MFSLRTFYRINVRINNKCDFMINTFLTNVILLILKSFTNDNRVKNLKMFNNNIVLSFFTVEIFFFSLGMILFSTRVIIQSSNTYIIIYFLFLLLLLDVPVSYVIQRLPTEICRHCFIKHLVLFIYLFYFQTSVRIIIIYSLDIEDRNN